ncbi:MAG: DUF1549 domain-containing protein, partial [Verrucomicrobiota bacterium]
VLVSLPAILVLSLFLIFRGDPGPPEGKEVASTPVAPSLSAEERYDRSRMAELGGATLAHPETATNPELATATGKIEFNRDIRPILSDNCFFCHGPDEADRKAGLRLDMEVDALADLGGYAAIVKGDAEASELVARIFDHDPDSIMPPPESSRRLSEEQKQILKRWVEEGAEWQQHWAFEKPIERELPSVSEKDEAMNAIDHFVFQRLEEKGWEPSSEASKETLIRRVSLDLTGLPPTVSEVDRFLHDTSPEAYEKVVDRLLDSTAHAERMAWIWMEASRYADTDGYQNDGPRDMWRWRDWVIDAYRHNMPFDQFAIEQLAGDLLPEPTTDQLIATGFNRNSRYNSESGLVLEEFLLENAVDRSDTTMTVFLGLTMACARCHDHKYDPLTHKDYHGMLSFFDNITESGRAIKFGNSEPWIKAPTPTQQAEMAEIEYRLGEVRAELAAAEEEIAKSQAAWEQSAPEIGGVIVPNGLDHQFGVEEAIVAGGEKPVNLETKVDGIVSNGRFSVAFDLLPEQVEKGAVLSNEAAGTTRQGFFVAFHEGHLRFTLISRWIAGVGMLETKQKFNPGERIHIALTNDGTQRSRGMEVWVNGERVPTRTLHNTNSNTVNRAAKSPMLVGGSKHLPGWKGEVSNLRFYTSRTLTESEIQMLAEPASAGSILAMAPEERTALRIVWVRSCWKTLRPNSDTN